MKTNFEHEEVRDFLLKKIREVNGEAMLLPKNEEQLEWGDAKTNMSSFKELLFRLGQSQGHILGQMAMLKSFFEFFEVPLDDEEQ